MAEAPDTIEKTLEELEREISCAVCHCHYQQAKLLSCNHYYCKSCIEDLVKHARGKPFDCPECRRTTTLPHGGVAELDGAFFVERMKDLYGKMAKVDGRAVAVCEQCVGGGRAVAFCRQCAEFICDDCASSHKKIRWSAGHKITTLSDLKRGGATKDILLNEAPFPKCAEHEEQMKIFCFDCDRLVCRDCVLYDHREHKSDFVKKCASDSRKTLRESLAPLRKVRANIADAEKAIVAEKKAVIAQNNAVCASIQQCFDKLKALLDQRKAELVKQANKLAQGKEDVLTAQAKDLQIAQTEIQSLVEFVERNIENTSDQDLMSICTQLQTKMKDGEKHHRKTMLKPATTSDVVCGLPSLDAIPRDLGAVMAIDPPKVCSVGEPTQFSLKVPQSIGCSVQVQLKSLVDPSCIVDATVTTTGNDDTYVITYTPLVRGRHDLILKVNAVNITGSPFQVFVNIHTKQLGKPIHIIDGFNSPWGIAINNKHQLVVTERGDGGKISIIECRGKKVKELKCDSIQSPRGVATGSDGSVYVTDGAAGTLSKLNEDGKVVNQTTRCLSSPLFANIINDKIYVSNISKNEIQIFDMECNLKGSIDTSGYPLTTDIAEYNGLLYVSSYGKKSIDVYQCYPGGKYVRHVNIKECKEMRGLCFDKNGYLYVTYYESGSQGVYVYDCNGEYITSFGLNKSGMLQSPVGIVIDDDGFVYVCDNIEDGKVYIF